MWCRVLEMKNAFQAEGYWFDGNGQEFRKQDCWSGKYTSDPRKISKL